MTAANLWVGEAAACLLTDTAGTANDGSIIGFMTKVSTSDRLRMAISHNGYGSHSVDNAIAEWMDSHPEQEPAMHDFPRLIDRLAIMLRDASEIGAQHDETANWGPPEGEAAYIQLFIAIWSTARNQPEAYIIGSHQGLFPPQVRPRRLFPVGCYIAPDIDAALRPKIDRAPDLHFDAHRDGLRMIKAQRFVPNDRGHLVVGGCAELTTVDAAGARTELLHVWQDKINRPIQPRWYERWERWADGKSRARKPV